MFTFFFGASALAILYFGARIIGRDSPNYVTIRRWVYGGLIAAAVIAAIIEGRKSGMSTDVMLAIFGLVAFLYAAWRLLSGIVRALVSFRFAPLITGVKSALSHTVIWMVAVSISGIALDNVQDIDVMAAATPPSVDVSAELQHASPVTSSSRPIPGNNGTIAGLSTNHDVEQEASDAVDTISPLALPESGGGTSPVEGTPAIVESVSLPETPREITVDQQRTSEPAHVLPVVDDALGVEGAPELVLRPDSSTDLVTEVVEEVGSVTEASEPPPLVGSELSTIAAASSEVESAAQSPEPDLIVGASATAPSSTTEPALVRFTITSSPIAAPIYARVPGDSTYIMKGTGTATLLVRPGDKIEYSIRPSAGERYERFDGTVTATQSATHPVWLSEKPPAPPRPAAANPPSNSNTVYSSPTGYPPPPAFAQVRATPAYVVNFLANELELRDLTCPRVYSTMACGITADSGSLVRTVTNALFDMYLQPADSLGWQTHRESGSLVGGFRRSEGLYMVSIAGDVVSIAHVPD